MLLFGLHIVKKAQHSVALKKAIFDISRTFTFEYVFS